MTYMYMICVYMTCVNDVCGPNITLGPVPSRYSFSLASQ